MKNKCIAAILLISNLAFSQQYDGVYIEKMNIDKNNRIYTPGREFVFSFKIIDNDSTYFLKDNTPYPYELAKNNDSLIVSDIYLTVIKPRVFQRTNGKQTEVYYSYNPTPSTVSSTGIVENDKNIWIHPPRDGFFKALETCPFPYIKLDSPIGYKWTDSMSIGAHWSNKKWGEWSGRLLLNYEYEIIGKEKIHSTLGEVDCIVINATATSKIGQSKLKSYYSEKYGFIKLEYTLFTGLEVELTAEKVVDINLLRGVRDFFENRYN